MKGKLKKKEETIEIVNEGRTLFPGVLENEKPS